MSLSLASLISSIQRLLSISPTSPPRFLRMSCLKIQGNLPTSPTTLKKTITTLTNNTKDLNLHPHSSLKIELFPLSSHDNISRSLYLPLERNIQLRDPLNRLISPKGRMGLVILPCPTISPRLIRMVIQVHGFRIQVCSRHPHLVDRPLGRRFLDMPNSTIPTNRSDVGYLVEPRLLYLCE